MYKRQKLDYFITAGDTPADIEANYTAATGRTPMMPEYGMGYWQCKLRYRTQEELLSVAREMKRRGLPLDAIVVDFFHWTRQGDFRFEPRDWPNPQAMVDELKAMGVETVVSVWPTIDEKSVNFGEMAERGLLVTADRGNAIVMTWMGNTFFFDATNPEAQAFVWEQCKKNYYQYGIRCFWLDESEPEYGPYDFDNYRYYAGPALQCTNTYPVGYAKCFYDGLREAGETEIIAEGVRYLHIEGAFYCGIGCLFLLYGLYRAVAKPGMSVVLTIISLGTRVVLAYLLSAVIGVTGIWWSVPIGWFLADVTGVVYYFIHKEKLLHFGESNLKRTES